jgi:DHA2 family lincomycin resistance protein-like MFS transporter
VDIRHSVPAGRALLLLTSLIQRAFRTSPYAPIWTLVVGNATFAASAPAGPWLKDRLGLRPTALLGAGAGLVGGVVCAAAPAFWVLLAGRFIQGAGAGMLLMALIPTAFRAISPKRRPWVIAILLGGLFGSFALGPVLGGLGVADSAWRGVFWLAAGLSALALAFAAGLPAGGAARDRPSWDTTGFALWAAVVGGLAVGTGYLRQYGPFSPAVWPAYLVAVLAAVLLVPATQQVGQPWVDWRHLARTRPLLGTATACSALVALILCIGPIHSVLAKVLHVAPLTMAALFLAIPAGVAVVAIVLAMTYDRLGPGLLGMGGALLVLACALWLWTTGPATTLAALGTMTVLAALGVGATFASGMIGAAMGGGLETLPSRMTAVQGARLLVYALLAPAYAWVHHSFIRQASGSGATSVVARSAAVHHLAVMAIGFAALAWAFSATMAATGKGHTLRGARASAASATTLQGDPTPG